MTESNLNHAINWIFILIHNSEKSNFGEILPTETCPGIGVIFTYIIWQLEEQWGKDALTLAVKAGTELVYKMMNFYHEKDFLLVWFDQCLYTIKSSLEEKFNPHEDSEEEE